MRGLIHLSCVCTLVLTSGRGSNSLADGPANRLTYLDAAADPYYVHRDFPRLTTPQWIGQRDVQAVVVLAIDDLRDTATYEAFLRPILNRLRQIDTQAGLSIMTRSVDPHDPQLQSWLAEGVTLEAHTLDHPCPLLAGGQLEKARDTYERCIDLLWQIPGNQPVAFRMPCCDSQNSPSPRFWSEIFNHTTAQGHFLEVDSSVFNVVTPADQTLPQQLTTDASGRSRFQKYLPFPSFVNQIHDYPYPFVIGQRCWEFPCTVPSDWEAQYLHRPNNPQTVDDWKAAIDVTVRKQGVFTLVFHPHNWIRNDQVVELIDYAAKRYSGQVRFLNFRQCLQRLNRHLLAQVPLRDRDGKDQGVRLLDVDHDGFIDVVIRHPDGRLTTRLWRADRQDWTQTTQSLPNRSIHFGVLDPSGWASLVAVRRDGLAVFGFADGRWIERPWHLDPSTIAPEWIQRLAQPAELDAIRLRDLEGDGRCELLLGAGDQSLLLTLSAVGTWQTLPFRLPPGVRLAA